MIHSTRGMDYRSKSNKVEEVFIAIVIKVKHVRVMV